MREPSVDVLILGGGPAGSTAGTILADAGIAPVILEAESFPRFHVGESLLPHTLPLLDRLVRDDTNPLSIAFQLNGLHDYLRRIARAVGYAGDERLEEAVGRIRRFLATKG